MLLFLLVLLMLNNNIDGFFVVYRRVVFISIGFQDTTFIDLDPMFSRNDQAIEVNKRPFIMWLFKTTYLTNV